LQPVLFHLGGFAVHGYGVCYALATAVGILWARRLASRDGIGTDAWWDICLGLIVGMILGARLEYVRTHVADFASDPARVLALRDGGLVFYGGLIGGVAGMALVARWRGLSLLAVLDAFAVSTPLAHAIGRVGCVLAGCCWGRPTDLPWALRYPASHASHGVPVHPVQLYEAAFNVALSVALARVHARRAFRGQALAIYLIVYAAFRAVNESFRGDAIRGVAFAGLSNAQATSLGLVIAGLGVVWLGRRSTPAPT